MDYPEKTFQVLDTLDTQEILTQRQLADHAGISLGQVNYILKSLLERGLVKIGNFRKNPHKISYMYLLTPKGTEAKSKLAVKFTVCKLNEYSDLRNRLAERLVGIEKKSHVRIIFVGPKVVLNCLESIIDEMDLGLDFVDHLENWEDLSNVDPNSFDVALWFDDNSESIKKVANALELPQDKLIHLW